MNPCTTEAPLCVAAPRKPRPRPRYLSKEESIAAGQNAVRSLRKMGEIVPRAGAKAPGLGPLFEKGRA